METKNVVRLDLTDTEITNLKCALRTLDNMSRRSVYVCRSIFDQVDNQFPSNYTCDCELCGCFTTPYLTLEEENKKTRHALWRSVALNIAAVLAGIALILL